VGDLQPVMVAFVQVMAGALTFALCFNFFKALSR